MIYGYARVSTREQCLDRQYEALRKYKVLDMVFSDKQSGKDFAREQYQAMKSSVQNGDEVVIEELDRLGRNKDEIKAELEWFKLKGVAIRILDVPTTLIDFQGQDWIRDMVNNILIEVLGSIAEQERIKIRKRQAEGIAAKKARGEWEDYGRPRIITDDFQKFLEKQKGGQMTVGECCEHLGISRSTWYKRVKEGDLHVNM